MTMTTKQADKAIKNGGGVNVLTIDGVQIALFITSRDRRCVDAVYEWDGKILAGRFARADLTVMEGAAP